MATFTLTVQSDNAAFISALLDGVGGPSENARLVIDPTRVEPTSSESVGATEPRKRGRKPKAEAKEEPAPEAVGSTAAEPESEDDDFGSLEEETPVAPKVTKQQLSDKFVELGRKKGRPAIDAIIKELGAAKFSELAEEKYSLAVEKIEAELKK